MTRGTLKTALQALGYSTDTDTAQNEAVAAAVRRVAGIKRWPWQESTSAAATIAVGGSALSALPANFLHPDAVRITFGSETSSLDWVQPQEIRQALHLDQLKGLPYWWTYYAGQVLVYPRADRLYTATLDYVSKPAAITADSDTLPGPDNYHDLYKWLAAEHLAFRERDWNAYNAARAQRAEAMGEMTAELGVKQRQTSRQVTRSREYASGAYIGPGAY